MVIWKRWKSVGNFSQLVSWAEKPINIGASLEGKNVYPFEMETLYTERSTSKLSSYIFCCRGLQTTYNLHGNKNSQISILNSWITRQKHHFHLDSVPIDQSYSVLLKLTCSLNNTWGWEKRKISPLSEKTGLQSSVKMVLKTFLRRDTCLQLLCLWLANPSSCLRGTIRWRVSFGVIIQLTGLPQGSCTTRKSAYPAVRQTYAVSAYKFAENCSCVQIPSPTSILCLRPSNGQVPSPINVQVPKPSSVYFHRPTSIQIPMFTRRKLPDPYRIQLIRRASIKIPRSCGLLHLPCVIP